MPGAEFLKNLGLGQANMGCSQHHVLRCALQRSAMRAVFPIEINTRRIWERIFPSRCLTRYTTLACAVSQWLASTWHTKKCLVLGPHIRPTARLAEPNCLLHCTGVDPQQLIRCCHGQHRLRCELFRDTSVFSVGMAAAD